MSVPVAVSTTIADALRQATHGRSPPGEAPGAGRTGGARSFEQSLMASRQAASGKSAEESRRQGGKTLPPWRLADSRNRGKRTQQVSTNPLAGGATVPMLHLRVTNGALTVAAGAQVAGSDTVAGGRSGRSANSHQQSLARGNGYQRDVASFPDGESSRTTTASGGKGKAGRTGSPSLKSNPKAAIETRPGLVAERTAKSGSTAGKHVQATTDIASMAVRETSASVAASSLLPHANHPVVADSTGRKGGSSTTTLRRAGNKSGAGVWRHVDASIVMQQVRRPVSVKEADSADAKPVAKGKAKPLRPDAPMASGPAVAGPAAQMQPSTPAPGTLAATPPSIPHDFSDLLSRHMVVMLSHGRQDALLHLSPPHLGTVQVHLSTDQQSVNAVFVSPQADVRQALEAAMPALRQALAQQGLSLAGGFVADQGYGQSSGREARPRWNAAARSPAAMSALAETLLGATTATRYISRGVSIYV